MKIRDAQLEDLQTIVSFNAGLARETEAVELDQALLSKGVRRALSEPNFCKYYVAEIDGKVVGQIMVTFELTDWFDGINWWIQSVYVHADYRGQGIYRKLYEHVKSLAHKNGNVPRLRLYVEKDNKAAVATYEKLGMERRNFYFYQESLT